MTAFLRPTRRTFLAGLALAVPATVRASPLLSEVDFRGALNAPDYGIHPGTLDRGSKAFIKLLKEASARNMPVFLPPGTYEISNIDLPDNVRLQGVAGATRLVYGGEGKFLGATGAKFISLSGLVIDGANRWLADDQQGLVTFRSISNLTIEDCEIAGAAKFAIWAEGSSGKIAGNTISGAAESAIYAVDNSDFEIRDNRISDCGNGGILVHRWTKGRDGTIVSGNRIQRIAAHGGGTGQNGNGINIFRADDVLISDNHISNCAFTAIRSNAGSNVLISANHCTNSGETAIYSEFGFEGAVIANNVIDGAANGILSVNFNEGGRLAVISGNLIRNLKLTAPYEAEDALFGIGLEAEAEASVTGNVIENAPRWGMLLGWGPYGRNISATGNVVRKAKVGCAVTVVEGAGPILVRNNQFSDCSEAAISGYRWIEKSSGELASNDGKEFPHIDIGGNQVS
ncbi:TIGR03808 family TAT-translocated repetitive protein [Rhizobium sp. KVB221]|uniref:TIGR03808 family TAT-translocated repetitive protein n=1 Tax=Rhizobium setariae TaxID=2801340 RepID=A0A936YW92_9HYPH|nr:TIGR03808 family TAT-translocated repetitive protein [Rhizobium setariae]MBL0374445.1 TIGR03808 family TAT-translocated repetitive protein [Rhizobium setariae]